MSRNEKQTRQELIDPKLELAGWPVLTKKNIIEKDKACIEIAVTGLPATSQNPKGNGFADYVLFGDNGKPLAVIEAKKAVVNEDTGRMQAHLYADALEKQYGVRPVIYYTNGYAIKIEDGIYPPRQVFGFHKKEELERLIQKRTIKIVDKTPDAKISGRYYQQDAIAEVINHLESKHSRSLIVLATGTGKTRVSCGLSDIFIRNNFVKRILFLADRKNLVKQAKEETFEKYLPAIPMATIIEGKRDGADDARIVFSTYQSMLSVVKDTTKSPFGIGHFDLIIVDEAHRSLFNKYAEIFQYFDALMIGLTATPRNDIHKSTYKVFNLDTDTPNYEYDVVKAVKDGFLVYFRALDRTPEVLQNGLVYNNLSEQEKEEYEELFTEDDGTVPEKIEGKLFKSVIYNKGTIDTVLKQLMDEGLKVNNGDVLGKTIIFARDHRHAELIKERFNLLYPEKYNPAAVHGVDYCVIIDNQTPYNEILQREFKTKQDIRIVISVDMMDTGVDIPEVVNLVFFKKVASKIKFWQMIGRGTRLCDNLKVLSPSKAYFERQTNDATRTLYDSKQGFLIFDVCDVFNFFNMNPDGEKDKSDVDLSLNQKVFLEKVALYKSMQSHFGVLNKDERLYFSALRDSLIDEVKLLNRNYIGVERNLEYVEKYSDVSGWMAIGNTQFNEIKKHIAPNIEGVIDIESAKIFDYLAYKFMANKIQQNKDFSAAAETIFHIAEILYNYKLSISEVAKSKATLEYIQSNDFIYKTTITDMNAIRIEVRELMRYIERVAMKPIITDFQDKISVTGDADTSDVDFSITIDDFKSFKDKVLFYIQNNPNDAVISDIRNLKRPQTSEVTVLKTELRKLAKSDDDFTALFDNDDAITTFIRQNIEMSPVAISHFIDRYKVKGYSDEQLNYIKELFIFINQNGYFERKMLLIESLRFVGIFNNLEINELLIDIESCL